MNAKSCEDKLPDLHQLFVFGREEITVVMFFEDGAPSLFEVPRAVAFVWIADIYAGSSSPRQHYPATLPGTQYSQYSSMSFPAHGWYFHQLDHEHVHSQRYENGLQALRESLLTRCAHPVHGMLHITSFCESRGRRSLK